MNALPRRIWLAARRRDAAITLAFGLPWLAAITLLAAHLGGSRAAGLALATLALLSGALVIARWRRRDARWLVRALDAARPDLDDSADLLLPDAAPSALQRLQRQRLLDRLQARPADLRAPWPAGALACSFALAAGCALAAGFWPAPSAVPEPVARTAVVDTGPLRLIDTTVEITPPPYTGLPPTTSATLSLRAPQDSRLRWRLRFSSPPREAALLLLDGRRVTLTQEGDLWLAELGLDRSVLYRIEADGVALGDAPARLDAIADQPPQIRVLAPEHGLSQAAPGQRRWSVAFEASDDHALAGFASLRITHTQGSGENIGVSERTLRLRGEGEPARRRYAHALDLAGLGYAPGDDLIVQLAVRDTRTPVPQETRSASLILRWSNAGDAGSGDLEAAVQRVLPAYFRSQRQIILDAEALLREEPALEADAFARRADALGVDQRILRLRYGQFLGEESEGAPGGLATGPSEDGDDHDDAGGHDDNDHAREAHPESFGQDMDLIASFGHSHDIPEAATLLDARTREVLRKALGQMWQSELGLRQAQPQAALPHAYRALDLIKEVQQADRIYLPRLGTDLPPIDEARRLGGTRDGLASRPDPLRPAQLEPDDLPALWRALGDMDTASLDPTLLQRLRAALAAQSGRAADPLVLQEALDAAARQPDCRDCRHALRAALWPLLDAPPAAVPRRPAHDAAGARYLDALRAGETE